jgi:hypothetical protein
MTTPEPIAGKQPGTKEREEFLLRAASCFPLNVLSIASVSQSALNVPLRLRTDQLDLGQGFNSATGDAGGLVVQYDGEPEELITASGGKGQDISYKVEHLTTTQDVFRSLSLSAAASFGIGIFSSEASVEFLTTTRQSRFSTYLLIELSVRNPTEFLRNYRLSAEAKQLVLNDPEQFFRFCGDTFVSGRVTGGSLFAIAEYSTDYYSTFESLNATISLKVAGYGSGNAKMSDLLSIQETNTRSRLLIAAKGGLQIIPNIAELDQAFLEFPKAVGTDAVQRCLIEVILSSYDVVGELPHQFPRSQFFAIQRFNMHALAILVDDYERLKAHYKAVIRKPWKYVITPPSPSDRLASISATLATLYAEVEMIRQNPTHCIDALTIPTFDEFPEQDTYKIASILVTTTGHGDNKDHDSRYMAQLFSLGAAVTDLKEISAGIEIGDGKKVDELLTPKTDSSLVYTDPLDLELTFQASGSDHFEFDVDCAVTYVNAQGQLKKRLLGSTYLDLSEQAASRVVSFPAPP